MSLGKQKYNLLINILISYEFCENKINIIKIKDIPIFIFSTQPCQYLLYQENIQHQYHVPQAFKTYILHTYLQKLVGKHKIMHAMLVCYTKDLVLKEENVNSTTFFFTFNIFEICTPSPHLRSFMSAMALTFNCLSRLSGTDILVQVALNQHDPHKPMVLVMFYLEKQGKYVLELSVRSRYKVRTIVRFWNVLAAISLLI